MYHERQRLALCGVHALNNLLQEHKFSKRDFDAICSELAPDSGFINPHRSILGIGNYDVNVLMVLLDRSNLKVQWLDSREDVTEDLLNDYKPFGILVNLPSTSALTRMGILKGRHWLSLLWHKRAWWNVDSELPEPETIGDTKACVEQLRAWKGNTEECHILLIRQK